MSPSNSAVTGPVSLPCEVYRKLWILAATCSVLYVAAKCDNADYLGDDIPGYFRIQRLLARQWIHVWRQFTCFGYFTYFPRKGVLGSSLCTLTPLADEEVAALVVHNSGMAGFCRVRRTSRCVGISRYVLLVVGRPMVFG